MVLYICLPLVFNSNIICKMDKFYELLVESLNGNDEIFITGKLSDIIRLKEMMLDSCMDSVHTFSVCTENDNIYVSSGLNLCITFVLVFTKKYKLFIYTLI